MRNGKVKTNPVRLVRQRKESSGVIRFLLDDEETRLRAVISEHYPSQMPELDVSLGTGMRLGEQYGERLLWEQVDFQRREIRLKKTKNGKGRTIPMNASVYAALELRKEQGRGTKPKDAVFPADGPRWWWDDAREKAGLHDYRWHDNRHTFCSRLAMRGVNLKAIQELAGHKTLAITSRYAHLDDGALRLAVSLLDQEAATDAK
jgi:site-specific recombinase XerD